MVNLVCIVMYVYKWYVYRVCVVSRVCGVCSVVCICVWVFVMCSVGVSGVGKGPCQPWVEASYPGSPTQRSQG